MSGQLNVLILGYGEMGHAMEYLLDERQQLYVWDKYPVSNFQSVVLEEVASDVDIVLFCLPVNPHREIATRISPLLKSSCLCISIAKGLDEAGQSAAQIFHDVFSTHQPYALLYGPMVSEEIRAGRYAFAQLGCDDADMYNRVCAMFANTHLYIEHTSDITGISWSVILKNVYALVFGMADELQLGDNVRGYLLVVAMRELEKIVCDMGGRSGSPYHLAGLGDLVTTATSEASHHHELGRMLARGELDNIKGEGVHTLEMIGKFQLINIEDFPLFNLIHDIVSKSQDVNESILSYLARSH